MSVFKGSCVALSTPFTKDGINFDTLAKLIEFHIDNKTDSILVCGTTGEPSTMTTAEKCAVIDFTVKRVSGRIPIIAGAGTNNTVSSVEMAKKASELGADAILAVTPYYNKCSVAGLIKHFNAMTDASKLPTIVYNVPSRTGLNITPDTLLKLSENKYIVGIKEASANITQIVEMARLCEGKIDLYAGNDDHAIPIMSVGGLGVISVTANVAPKEVHDMATAYLNKDLDTAKKLQFMLNPLSAALFSDVNPIPVKTALRLMGFDMGELRLPLCDMSYDKLDKLKVELAKLGKIN
ncbi:MAG: 4-hydroxy-tetrahydrodipicolinate synthase [Eubacteriales bacterium]